MLNHLVDILLSGNGDRDVSFRCTDKVDRHIVVAEHLEHLLHKTGGINHLWRENVDEQDVLLPRHSLHAVGNGVVAHD